MKRTFSKTLVITALGLMLLAAGCKKKTTPPPPPPPPPAPAPTATLTAEPSSIERGQSVTLSWNTEYADEVTLEPLGKVGSRGEQTIFPESSTTYRLVATGKGGTKEATARVTVTEPPAPPPTGPTKTEEELFQENVKDAFFDYDKFDVRPDAERTLAANARFLAQHPNIKVIIEGHCDERGSTEYNLALGDNRANAAKQALVRMGIDPGRIRTISYGKEKPFCFESNERCWQLNRRGHFVLWK